MSDKNPLYTVGHGARSLDEFLEVLIQADIGVLIDVRRFPGSRRHPHFSRESLARSLEETGTAYEWWGESLGGRRKPSTSNRHSALRNASFRAYAEHMESSDFRTALSQVVDRSRRQKLAVMCAETLWWKCHRRLIADAVVAGGLEVVHLGAGKDSTHSLTREARLDDDILVYDGTGEEAPGERLF